MPSYVFGRERSDIVPVSCDGPGPVEFEQLRTSVRKHAKTIIEKNLIFMNSLLELVC